MKSNKMTKLIRLQNGKLDPIPRYAYNYCNSLCDLCKKKNECPVSSHENFEKHMLQVKYARAFDIDVPQSLVGKYEAIIHASDEDEEKLFENESSQFDRYLETQDSFFTIQIVLNALIICQTMMQGLLDREKIPRKAGGEILKVIDELTGEIKAKFGKAVSLLKISP